MLPTTWLDEFPILARSAYLNSCSLGALSRRVREAVGQYHDEWEARGAPAWYDTWLPRLAELRDGYALVVGAASDEIALHESISAGAAVVASALDYRRRPRVVTTSLDFPTIAYQWLARARDGVELVVVESPDGLTVPPDLLAEAVDERTALVATSHVYFTTGAEQDLGAVADAAHRHGALVYIDGYQAAGQVPVDVPASKVDFYAAGGLKWLLGGPGIAFLYVRRGLHALEPTVTGWFAHNRPFTFDIRHHERLPDARRFELGTPALAAVHAQIAGLRLLSEIGPAHVLKRTRELQAQLIDTARSRGLSPRVGDRQTAIVTFPDPDPAAAVARLADRGVIVDARPGHVRVSPFFYNSADDIQAFFEAY